MRQLLVVLEVPDADPETTPAQTVAEVLIGVYNLHAEAKVKIVSADWSTSR